MDLHTLLIALIDRLLTLKDRISEPAQIAHINNVKRILFTLLDQVVEQDLDKNSRDYQNALRVLAEAKSAAESAVQNIEQTAAAIDKAVSAAKSVDKVVQLFVRYLA